MSSGGVFLLAPAVGVVAVGAVVVAAAAVAAGAVLAVRAANAAVESGVRAVGDYGAKLEQEVARLDAEAANARRWEYAAADVVAVNARIRMLREQAAAAGVQVDMPSPIKLGSCVTLDQLRGRARQTQAELIAAQALVDSQVRLLQLTVKVETAKSVATRAAIREALVGRYAAVASTPSPITPDEIAQIVAQLDADASISERAKVFATASAALDHPDKRTMYLGELRDKVHEEINPRVRGRRQAATWVETLETEPVAEVLAGIDPPGPLAGTMAKLREVVRGNADLTDDLRREAKRLMTWAEQHAAQALRRDLAQQQFIDMGYTVETTYSVNEVAGMRLTRPEWNSEHTVEAWVDDENMLRTELVRQHRVDSDDAQIRELSRCAAMIEDTERAANSIGGAKRGRPEIGPAAIPDTLTAIEPDDIQQRQVHMRSVDE